MGERLRSVNTETINTETIAAAVGSMRVSVQRLDDLLWQLGVSIDQANRAGGGVLLVEVLQRFQGVGRARLGEFRDALDRLTVGGRRSTRIGALAGTARGGTDTEP